MLKRLQKSLDEKDEGFTLIELLVVIVIIGILAAIAIPLFLSQREKAAEASLKSDLKNAATVMETDYVESQNYTTTVVGDFKTDDNNTLAIASADTDGYCLNGTIDGDAAPSWSYDSGAGGLQSGAC